MRIASLFLFLSLTLTPSFAQALEVDSSVPSFTLTDQDSKQVSLADLKGKVVLVTFLFTRCPYPDKCPMISEKLGQTRKLMEKLKANDRIHVMAISLDPRHDTPEVLKAYAQGYDTLYPNYSFLTGKPEDVAKVAGLFGVIYWEQDGTIEHNMRTVIIGPDQKVRHIERGADFKVGELAAKIQKWLPKQ